MTEPLVEQTEQIPPHAAIPRRAIRRRRRRRFFIALLLIAVVLFLGNRRLPTRGATGAEFSQPWPAGLLDPQTLRVATYNIDGGVGLDGHYDLGRIADAIRGYDLIGMNEVHGYLFAPPHNQAEELGTELGLPWLYAPSEERWFHDDFGNAVISMVPVPRWLRLPLPGTQDRGHRNVVFLSVSVAGRNVNVLITHLDRERDRSAQLQSIKMLFFSLAEPVLLMGDLNRYPDDPELQPLIHGFGVEDCLARFPSPLNAHRVDWILVRGMTAINAGFDEAGHASDHPLAWAELRVINNTKARGWPSPALPRKPKFGPAPTTSTR